VFSSNN